MSDTTNDPTKYWRTGVAISVANKKTFDERISQLGLRTVGDLVSLFILADDAVEALAPVAQKFAERGGKSQAKAENRTKIKEVASQLQTLSPQEIAKLLALVKGTVSTEAV